MKKNYLLLFIICFTAHAVSKAQIRFKNNSLAGANNVLTVPSGKEKESLKAARFASKNYVLLHFTTPLSAATKAALAAKGIQLFDYIPDNAFYAEVPEHIELSSLKSLGVDGTYVPGIGHKASAALLQQKQTVTPDQPIAVRYFGSFSRQQMESILQAEGAVIMATKIQPANTIFVQASATVVEKITALPFVSYVYVQPLKDIPLNYNNQGLHSIHTLSNPLGRNLRGRNVVIGIGDDADPTHIDFTGRLINRTPAAPAHHGTHVTGTAGSAGIANPKYQGMAPKATLISQYFSDILVNTPLYKSEYGMELTNNSYHSSADGCAGDGDYDGLSNYADAQMNTDVELLHVFAAGNDGELQCTPYPNTFATVKSGFQSSKNPLIAGAVNVTSYNIANFSSRGPLKDGRIKPEVVAGGQTITSTIPGNTYGTSNGTSMASPTVTGTVALLVERYRQLHGGSNPPATLLKAITCNSADDLGNPGPDFTFGFGLLNARTAVEALEGGHYFQNSVAQGATIIHTIPAVPAGTYQLKVMLHWNDPAASPAAAVSLVNNLNLTVTGTDAVLHRPLILDPAPSNVTVNAVEGIDQVNNIEQVVINNPPAGDVTISVTGATIPSGSQPYVVTYQLIQPSVTLEYPSGSETLVPTETETIRWNAYGGGNNTFHVEFSADNGGTWSTISNNIPATERSVNWNIPDTVSSTALIRITQNGSGLTDMSDNVFTILGQPVLTLTKPCIGYAQLDWTVVDEATGYEILQLKDDSLQAIATTTSNTWLLSGLPKDNTQWLAVRTRYGAAKGRASTAKSIVPNSGPCTLPDFNNDLTIDSLMAPVTGRQFTSSQLGTIAPRIRVRNRGSVAISGTYQLSYQVNGGTIITESSSAAIGAGAAVNYTFTQSFNFSTPGSYQFKAWVKFPSDTQAANDTVSILIKHLQNDPLTLSPVFTEGFEGATANTYTKKTIGLDGLDRCDFIASNTNGRVRTFINTGFARTGQRSIILDQIQKSNTATFDSVIATFNLSNYATTENIWLDFQFRNQGIDFSLGGNQVWIRGNDQSAWISVFTLPVELNDLGIWKAAKSINITETLQNAVPAQTFGSSFQVKFGEQGFTSTNSLESNGNLDDGVSYDDVTFTHPSNDVGVIAIANPIINGVCSLGNAEQITVRVKNYSAVAMNNIAVSYELNGSVTTETIATLAAGQQISHTFASPVNFSAYQSYTIRAWINVSGDTYVNNDSLQLVTFHTKPAIAAFPYLENFENNNGGWYTGGFNSSWDWGTPATSNAIIKKAASGTRAWVTNPDGNYNNNEFSYLYSPCFDLTGLTTPVLSFSHIFRIEDICDCDYHWVEYSTNGTSWTKLGALNSGTNWYNHSLNRWQVSIPYWHVASVAIPAAAKSARTQFRIVFTTDGGGSEEGIGIDDMHVFDRAAVYAASSIPTGISQPVSGNNWIHFTSGGSRIASIQPNGQNLGSTNVKLFLNSTGIRNKRDQYYLDRNIVIQPTTVPADSVTVRYYFTNTELNSLRNATGCATCTKPVDAYEAGVTQYSGLAAEENGSLEDNTQAGYEFLRPRSQVRIVPYDNGYYAEFKVGHFSEFWINGGGPGQDQPLPVVLESFTVTRQGLAGLLKWTTSQEINVSHFVIEKSTDGINFSPIGTVPAAGNSNVPLHYEFTDRDLYNGINYYRLRIFDRDNRMDSSPVRTLDAGTGQFTILIYPNPVKDRTVFIQSSEELSSIVLTDLSGRILRSVITGGKLYKLPLNTLVSGSYFIRVITKAGKKVEKILVP